MDTFNAADGFDFGQKESLTTRLKTLVRDYPEGLGIVKELLQNADDSRAKFLHLIFDWRTYPADQLREIRMAQIQGPALLACNDRVFTEADFTNITNLSSAGKLRDATKTGRFGQGFNSVYNLTDFPGFVTADRLVIFDPHGSAVANVTTRAPGRAWKLTPETWQVHGQLLEPFVSAGLPRGTSYFDHTIFRLPFRTAAQAQHSEIARKVFGQKSADDIITEVLKVKEQLLLFLKFLEEFRVSQITEDGALTDLLTISTENPSEVQSARDPLIQTLRGDFHEVLDRLESDDIPEPSIFTHRFRITTPERRESAAWQIVSGLFVDEDGDLTRAARELQQNDERAVPWAGAAACIEGGRQAGNGLAYCSLPLPIETGLPVHLHGLFDLDSSRSALTIAGGQTGRDRIRGEWNRLLLRHGVAAAYATLITSLAPTLGESDPSAFYALWPARQLSKPFDELLGALAKQIEDRPVFRCAGSDRWVPAVGIWVLPEGWAELQEPLVADGLPMADPILPPHIRRLLEHAEIKLDEYLPSELRKELRDPDFVVVQPEAAESACLRRREWLVSLLRFAISDGEGADLVDVPLALLADGSLRAFGGERDTLYLADDEPRAIFATRPQWFIDLAFATACELDEIPDAGLERMTPAILIKELAEFVSLETDAESRSWAIVGPEPPNAKWLCLVYRYLAPALADGFKPEFEVIKNLALVPARGCLLFAPGFHSTPLLAPADLTEATRVALAEYGVRTVEAPPELRQAIVAFVTLNPEVWIWRLTGPDVVGALAIQDELPQSGEDVHRRLIEFLADRRWLDGEANGYKESDLSELRGLPIFLTTSGQRVAIDEQTYLPTDLQIELPVPLKLLNSGPDGVWLPLYKKLGVSRLNRAAFIEQGILPGYASFDDATRLRALQWLRDHLDVTQTDLEAEKGAYEILLQKIKGNRLIRCTDGQYRTPRAVYDPKSRTVHEILDTSVPFPDMESTYASSASHWLKFFADIGLVTRPGALEIILRVDKLTAEGKQNGTAKVVQSLMSIYRYVSQYWLELKDKTIPLTNGTTSVFATLLRSRTWLPVEQDPAELKGYAAFTVPEDRLYQPSEVCFSGRPAHLAASQRPVFRGREPEVTTRAELGFVPVDLNTVLAQFDAAVERWEGEGEQLYDGFDKSLQHIYNELKKSAEPEDEAELPSDFNLISHFAGRPCLWHDRRFWLPEHAFQVSVPFFGARRITIPKKRWGIYSVLGMRTEPAVDDFVAYINEVADDAGSAPVPEAERSNVVKVFKLLGAVWGDAESDDSIKVLTTTGRLVQGKDVFSPDATWIQDRLDPSAIHLLLPELRVSLERVAGVRSLQQSVREQPTGEFELIHEGEASDAVRVWEQTLRSPEFGNGLQRLIEHQDSALNPDVRERLASLRVELTRRIVTDLFVTLDGVERRVGSGALSNSFFESSANTVFLAANQIRWLPFHLAEIVVKQVANISLPDRTIVTEMLGTAPEEIDTLLDNFKIRRPAGAQAVDGAIEPVYEQAEDSGDEADGQEEDLSDAPYSAVNDQEAPSDTSNYEVSDTTITLVPQDAAGRGHTRAPGSGSSFRSPRKPYRQNVDGERTPAPTRPAAASQKRQDRVVTYVVGSKPPISKSEEQSGNPTDSDDVDSGWKIKFGQQGVDLVRAYERTHGREPYPMGQTSPGYDIESHDPVTNVTRLIEVKSIYGAWSPRGVSVSRVQHANAMAHRDRYWLYVVERADSPNDAIIHAIQNPFERIQQYLFDDGWRGLATSESATATTLRLCEGSQVTVAGRGEGTVENIRIRGALTLLKIAFADGGSTLTPFNSATIHLLD